MYQLMVSPAGFRCWINWSSVTACSSEENRAVWECLCYQFIPSPSVTVSQDTPLDESPIYDWCPSMKVWIPTFKESMDYLEYPRCEYDSMGPFAVKIARTGVRVYAIGPLSAGERDTALNEIGENCLILSELPRLFGRPRFEQYIWDAASSQWIRD